MKTLFKIYDFLLQHFEVLIACFIASIVVTPLKGWWAVGPFIFISTVIALTLQWIGRKQNEEMTSTVDEDFLFFINKLKSDYLDAVLVIFQSLTSKEIEKATKQDLYHKILAEYVAIRKIKSKEADAILEDVTKGVTKVKSEPEKEDIISELEEIPSRKDASASENH